jgi:hypothetical protein
MLIPFANFIICIVLCIDFAKSVGKGAGFGIGASLFWESFSFRFPASAAPSIKALLLEV